MVTAKDLNRLIDGKMRERTVAFETILTMCLNKVKRYAQKRQYRCVFEVPEFLIGEPLYKLPNAISYLAGRLKEECGFYIRLFPPKLLYISWDMEEIDGRKVMQPMNMFHRSAHPQQQATANHPSFVPTQEYHPSLIHQNHTMPPVLLSVPSPLPLPIASRPIAKKKKNDGANTDTSNKPPMTSLLPNVAPGKRFNEIANTKPSGKFILNLA